MVFFLPLLLSCLLFATLVANGQETIQPVDFYNGMLNGTFDLVIDVRSESEWNGGHIENATFVESLATSTTIPPDIQGCEGECRTVVVYCQSGRRAGTAIDLMLSNGFNGTIYNGLGIGQWTQAGYPLVNTSSLRAPCATIGGIDTCPLAETDAPTAAPVTDAPSSSMAPSATPGPTMSPTPLTIGGPSPPTVRGETANGLAGDTSGAVLTHSTWLAFVVAFVHLMIGK